MRTWTGPIAAAAVLMLASGAAAQTAATWPPSEVMKTKEAEVVVSDVRYRDQDRDYPKPLGWNAAAYGDAGEIGRRLCTAATEKFKDDTAPTGWLLEKLLLDAAGASPAEPPDTRKVKVQRWWAAAQAGGRLHCNFLGRMETHFLQTLIDPSFDGYRWIDRVVTAYGLPLNDISLADGRTVLDWTAARIDETPPDLRRSRLLRIYGTLRRFGAKHRKELEAEGKVPSPPALARQRTAEYRAAAERGDLEGLQLMVAMTAGNKHSPANLAEAERWLMRTEARALELRDGNVLGSLGNNYLDRLGWVGPPFTGKRDRAVRVLTAASQGTFAGRNPNLARNDVSYDLGMAYYLGLGTAKDHGRALPLLAPLTSYAQAQFAVAEILLTQGRRREALAHLRHIAFSSQGGAVFRGMGVSEWLKAQPEGVCGADSYGQQRC